MKTTAIMSIGTALRRAQDAKVQASVLVGTHWLIGLVQDVDGHGVLLWDDDADTFEVIKLDSIDAVRITRPAVEGDAIPLQAVGS